MAEDDLARHPEIVPADRQNTTPSRLWDIPLTPTQRFFIRSFGILTLLTGAGWCFQEFSQLRGWVSLLASRVFLIAFGVCLFVICWTLTVNIKHRLSVRITAAILLIGVLFVIDRIAPNPERQRDTFSDLSNAQIKDGALALARRIRQLEQETREEENRIEAQEWSRPMDPIEFQRKLNHLRDKEDIRFGQLRAESRNVIFALGNRIPPPQPIMPELVKYCLSTGPCAGPSPYMQVADYIDQLADLVPVKR